MRTRLLLFLAVPILAGCDDMPAMFAPAGPPEPAAVAAPPPPEEIAAVVSAPPPPSAARTAADLDTTTEDQKAAAREAAEKAEGRRLGTTIASLGDPTEPGLWLKTPLVTQSTAGKIETESGAGAIVQLIPLDAPAGAGSQMSIAAFQALGLSLTDLPTLTVYGA